MPIVGGHTNTRCDRSQLSVAILGRAQRLLTSFDAKPGDQLIAAIDLRGRYREPFANWEAFTDASPHGCAATSSCFQQSPRRAWPAPPRTSARVASSAPRSCWRNAPVLAPSSMYCAFRARTASRSSAGCRHFRASVICSRFRHLMSRSCSRVLRRAVLRRRRSDRSPRATGSRSPTEAQTKSCGIFLGGPLIGCRTMEATA